MRSMKVITFDISSLNGFAFNGSDIFKAKKSKEFNAADSTESIQKMAELEKISGRRWIVQAYTTDGSDCQLWYI